MEPVPAFAFMKSRYDNELRSPLLESYYDFVRKPKSDHFASRAKSLGVSPAADSADVDSTAEAPKDFNHGRFRTLSEQQANIEYNYLMEHRENVRLVTYRADYQHVTRKLHRVVRSFIAEGGERESCGTDDKHRPDADSKWKAFRKQAIDEEINDFKHAGP